jgi:hypothetical protein
MALSQEQRLGPALAAKVDQLIKINRALGGFMSESVRNLLGIAKPLPWNLWTGFAQHQRQRPARRSELSAEPY